MPPLKRDRMPPGRAGRSLSSPSPSPSISPPATTTTAGEAVASDCDDSGDEPGNDSGRNGADAPDIAPDIEVRVGDLFGFDSDLRCPAFSSAPRTDGAARKDSASQIDGAPRKDSVSRTDDPSRRDSAPRIDGAPRTDGAHRSGEITHVPPVDPGYCFDPDTTRAIVAGFARNRRVLVQGRHGSGKSTHIEQVAARLNWPCIRVNLDGHVSRTDLVGKDAIVLDQGKQVTRFRPGIIPWCLGRPMALVFDEYDAGRSDVMFVIQRLLEENGLFTLLDRNEVMTPHPYFRLFATANTLGMGDDTGLYHGTQPINQGQMDRWQIIARLDYLDVEREYALLLSKFPQWDNAAGRKHIRSMVGLANLTREGFRRGDISLVMSPRTLIHWLQNREIFTDDVQAFHATFFNRCEQSEREIIAAYYQRCFGRELIEGDAMALKTGSDNAPARGKKTTDPAVR